MKLDQLRKIIREEVRAAVKEELQEVMNEAVKYASTPTKMQEVPKGQPKKWSVGKSATLDEMIAMTKSEMTNEDYRSVSGFDSSVVQKPNFASSMAKQMGLGNQEVGVSFNDIPGFNPAKAKALLDAANKKSKERVG